MSHRLWLAVFVLAQLSWVTACAEPEGTETIAPSLGFQVLRRVPRLGLRFSHCCCFLYPLASSGALHMSRSWLCLFGKRLIPNANLRGSRVFVALMNDYKVQMLTDGRQRRIQIPGWAYSEDRQGKRQKYNIGYNASRCVPDCQLGLCDRSPQRATGDCQVEW